MPNTYGDLPSINHACRCNAYRKHDRFDSGGVDELRRDGNWSTDGADELHVGDASCYRWHDGNTSVCQRDCRGHQPVDA